MKRVFMLLNVFVLLVVCSGCNKEPSAPATQPTTTIIRPDEATAKVELAKHDAMQEFQRFRTATTLSSGLKALASMEQDLGSVGLTHVDINLSDAEIVAHVFDLAHRKPSVKLSAQPAVAHKIKPKQHRK